MSNIEVKPFFDDDTGTLTYVVYDPYSHDAVVIDPILDYDPAASTTNTENLDKLELFIYSQNLKLHYCLETHAHADHLSGAQELKKRFPNIKIAIGEHITKVQLAFKKIYNLADSFTPDGSQFDQLLRDREKLKLGSLEIEVLFTPGHTPACASYLIGDALFTGDAIFMPDTGTGRCDFPDGSAEALYHSVHTTLYNLADSTRVFVGHDYKAGGTREAQWESSIAEQKLKNIHITHLTSKESYVAMRDARDKTLSAPKLLLASLQVNIIAGHMPPPESNGMSYLKFPIRNSK